MRDYAVTLEFDRESAQKMQKMIDEVASATGCDFMVKFGVPPHVTVSAIVCDDEGKIKCYELNRYIPNVHIIAGTFFICGLGSEDFTDLPDDLAKKYEKMFYEPEVIIRAVNCILILRADGTREVIQ